MLPSLVYTGGVTNVDSQIPICSRDQKRMYPLIHYHIQGYDSVTPKLIPLGFQETAKF